MSTALAVMQGYMICTELIANSNWDSVSRLPLQHLCAPWHVDAGTAGPDVCTDSAGIAQAMTTPTPHHTCTVHAHPNRRDEDHKLSVPRNSCRSYTVVTARCSVQSSVQCTLACVWTRAVPGPMHRCMQHSAHVQLHSHCVHPAAVRDRSWPDASATGDSTARWLVLAVKSNVA